MNLALIIFFTILGSICSVGIAGILLLFKGRRLQLISRGLVPYAIGTLLGAAFFGMIPYALQGLASSIVLPVILFGIILFFILEKFAVWRHCHEQSCGVHTRAGTLILIGDSLHNFVDGVAIAAAFSGSVHLGIATSVAVIAHEVPQEVGDFAIMLEGGYSRARALFFNALSSMAALPGAVMTCFLLPYIHSAVPYLLSVSAASFIYIALADLVPGRRANGGLGGFAWDLSMIAMGVGTIVLLRLNIH